MNTLHQDTPATGGESFDLQALTRAPLESALNAITDEQAGMAREGGANSRNGYRERELVTPAGKITPGIPKLRCGTYFPEGMLKRCSRADKAVAAAVAEMYANGVSMRKVERIARRMGIDRLSSSQVGRICKRLDAEVAALRAREFDIAMPYLFLDAAYVKRRRGGRAQSATVVAAIAVGAGGARRQGHASGVRAGRPRHGARGLPRRHRRDLVVFPQAQIGPLVKGDGVAISSRLPITGNTRLHQQSLTLIVIVGCHLGRQRESRPHCAHPFCQDEKTRLPAEMLRLDS